mgnify:CR=1 FL=1
MSFYKQNFNDEELALLFLAFAKKLFVRPISGDICSVPLSSGCCFYFKPDYYENLKSDIQSAYSQGKFAQSNASIEWQGLMQTFFSAHQINTIDSDNTNDYVSEVSKYWAP